MDIEDEEDGDEIDVEPVNKAAAVTENETSTALDFTEIDKQITSTIANGNIGQRSKEGYKRRVQAYRKWCKVFDGLTLRNIPCRI
jgi:3-deoxy-D-manno-octulosonic-acid transferase